MSVRIALAGAGLIGRRHGAALRQAGLTLAGVADPSAAARDWAAGQGAPWCADLPELLAGERPDGVIIATPNQTHLAAGLAAVEAGVPALIEKPIAPTHAEAAQLVAAAAAAGVPLLVGHHRRHNPLITHARQVIDSGRLGRIVAVHAVCWLKKPDDYFAPDWRRAPGAGPVLVNAIHDIDLLRHLCGEITEVTARASSATGGRSIEDTLVATLCFANGALGTITVSDSATAPWSWELTAGENPAYPMTGQTCYQIAGVLGALSLPDARLWRHDADGHWMAPIHATRSPIPQADPLVAQLTHFAAVIDGAPPLVSGAEGAASLRVVEALLQAAETGGSVRLT